MAHLGNATEEKGTTNRAGRYLENLSITGTRRKQGEHVADAGPRSLQASAER
jgi:hypothetical protein